ncbi:MAG: hypothetical protein EBX50_20045, partial [Chitinophagia bacterium]|nr:hypothetical protein [Chitinophagia bacterium]
AIYRRGEGNPAPFISLPTFNGYSETGNPNLFQPFGGYGSTGNPSNFNVFNAMPSPSNPMGDLNPVGESLPAQVGQPYRMGGEGIGGMPQMESMGSYYDDQPYNTWSGL